MIRTAVEVKEKLDLLQALGDIQAAMTFLNQSPIDDGVHPSDRHYSGLQCDIESLDPQSDTYKVTLNVKNFSQLVKSQFNPLYS